MWPGSGAHSDALRMAKRVPPITAMLSSISMIQNDRGSPASHATTVVSEPTRTMPKAIAEPTATATAIRVRSGTLANRQPRLYRPSLPFATSPDQDDQGEDQDERRDTVRPEDGVGPHRQGDIARDRDPEQVHRQQVPSAEAAQDADHEPPGGSGQILRIAGPWPTPGSVVR